MASFKKLEELMKQKKAEVEELRKERLEKLEIMYEKENMIQKMREENMQESKEYELICDETESAEERYYDLKIEIERLNREIYNVHYEICMKIINK